MKQRKMKNIAKRQYDKKFKMSWLDFRVALNLRLEEKKPCLIFNQVNILVALRMCILSSTKGAFYS